MADQQTPSTATPKAGAPAPADQLTVGWEQAVIGAMTATPGNVPPVVAILTPSHLRDPRHQALLAAAPAELQAWRVDVAEGRLTVPASPSPTQTRALRGAWATRWAARAAIAAEYLKECLLACPYPSRAAVYARGVYHAAVNRAAADAVHAPTGGAAPRAGRSLVDALASAGPERDQERLLAALVDGLSGARPDRYRDAAAVLARLRPQHFPPGLDTVYEALADLPTRRVPIDAVTVQMTAVERGALARVSGRRLAAILAHADQSTTVKDLTRQVLRAPPSRPFAHATDPRPSAGRLHALTSRLPRAGPAR